MKRALLLVVCVPFLGCHKDKEDHPAPSVAVQPPTTPVCGTFCWSSNGGIGPSRNDEGWDIIHPDFDANKGDTVAFSWKKWDATEWVRHDPATSPLKITISGNKFKLWNYASYQIDWAYTAIIHECH